MANDPTNPLIAKTGLALLKGSIPFVGLTGGIGSGKSAVSSELSILGAGVIDTDLIAHQITAPNGLAIPLIQKQFGSDFINSEGALIRDRMRSLVFSDTKARQNLEAITHPLIREETVRQTKHLLETKVPYIVFVVPLLLESGNWRPLLDCLVAVDCLEEMQIERVMHRSNLSRNEVEKILKAQSSRHERLANADLVIKNQCSLDDLKTEVAKLHQKILQIKEDRLSSS